MKKAIVALWIIGAILFAGTPAFSEGNPQPNIPFPDPSLVGRPVIPSPYINRPVVQPYIGGPGNPPYIGINQPYIGRPIIPPLDVQPPDDVQFVEPDYVSFIKKIEAIPENKIGIGIVALKLAKDIHPKLDIKAYSAKIDNLVRRIQALAQGSTDPIIRIRSIDTVLYWQEGMQYDFSDPLGDNIDTRLITGMLDNRKGVCSSMPLIYLAVAQRLGYPIYPVYAPQHLFLRYIDPNLPPIDIETTNKGSLASDETYIEMLHITPKQIKSGAYLRTLSYKEFLGVLISVNGAHWYETEDGERGLYYVAAARRLYSKSPDICKLLGQYLIAKSKYALTGKAALETRKTGERCLMKAEEMGVTHATRADYVKELSQNFGDFKEVQQFLKKRKSKGATK